jgi:hypothetical protein
MRGYGKNKIPKVKGKKQMKTLNSMILALAMISLPAMGMEESICSKLATLFVFGALIISGGKMVIDDFVYDSACPPTLLSNSIPTLFNQKYPGCPIECESYFNEKRKEPNALCARNICCPNSPIFDLGMH